MQRSYRVSFYIQWELLDRTRRCRRDVEARASSARRHSRPCCQPDPQIILGYQDHVASLVAETYTRDYEALNRSRAHVRSSLVQRRPPRRGRPAVRLRPGDPRPTRSTRHHVAVLLPGLPEGAATQLADGLRAAARAHQSAGLPADASAAPSSGCAGSSRGTPAALAAMVGRARASSGAAATVSSAATPGSTGFRAALRPGRRTPSGSAGVAWGRSTAPSVDRRYADAGLEILLLQDDDLARSFVEAELGPLAAATSEAARLRETLEASFRSAATSRPPSTCSCTSTRCATGCTRPRSCSATRSRSAAPSCRSRSDWSGCWRPPPESAEDPEGPPG